MLLRRTHVCMSQHPVGQGGLFYGALRHADGVYKWIYDCGAVNKDKAKLRYEVDKVSRFCDGKIDALYLSHFHADHYNGIKYLTEDKGVTVDDIIIPYLDDYEKFAILAEHHIEEVDITQEIIDFIMIPEKIFFALGFTRVIVVSRDYEDEDPETPSTDPESKKPDRFIGSSDAKDRDMRGSVYADRLEKNWKPKLQEVSHEFDLSKKLRNAESSAILELIISSSIGSTPVLKLEFVPHVRSILNEEYIKFKSEIESLKNQHGLKHIKEIMDIPNWLDEVAKCYRRVWPRCKQNSISMSLYIGPQKNQYYVGWIHSLNILFALDVVYSLVCNFLYRAFELFLGWLPWHFRSKRQRISYSTDFGYGGWLLTGDSVLLNHKKDRRKNYRDQFERRYREYSPNISVLMIPHHGSKNNISSEFFDFFENLDVCYVAANPRIRPYHPHREVKNMVPGPIFFHIVSARSESKLCLRYDYYWY